MLTACCRIGKGRYIRKFHMNEHVQASAPADTARDVILLGGRLALSLLPKAAYSARDPVAWRTLGVALQRQRGVHAIGSDRRCDFDTLPGCMAVTPAGVDVFSESGQGGEYLLVRWDPSLELGGGALSRRVELDGSREGFEAARRLRRMLLAPYPDRLALEEAALRFATLPLPPSSGPAGPAVARALEVIDDMPEQALTLGYLAAQAQMSELRFLRAFSAAVGMTPHAYIVEARLQAARRKLAQTDLPLALIALDCGFAHQSHLGSAFRAAYGMAPGEYRLRLIRAAVSART